MQRVFLRFFGREIEIVLGLAWRLLARRPPPPRPRRRPQRPPAPPVAARAGVPAAARPGAGVAEDLLAPLRRLARHRITILAASISILAHAGLLGMLGNIHFLGGEEETEEFRPIQIAITYDRGPRPETKPSAEKVKEEPPAAPPPPPSPEPEAKPDPDPAPAPAPPAPPVDIAVDEPGSPGTGEIARSEPEGRPGPPSILGVGSSPPPGESDGNGGEGEGEGMGSRTRGKAGLLKRYGGSDETEDAVSWGLAWLAAHQDLDGGWSAASFNLHCHHFTQCLGKGLEEFDVGVSALCTLAFLGAGQAPGLPGPYAKAVERAIEHLVACQRPDGSLGLRGDRYFYNHAIASFALCEAYSATRDARWLKPSMAALGFSARAQQAGGGWDYTDSPTGRNDLSITGWQVMAFRAARTAGFPVPDEIELRLRAYLIEACLPDGEAVYANKGMGAGRRGINMTAVALLSRLYLGTPLNDRWVRVAADRLMGHPPDPDLVLDWDTHYQSSYYWYYATLCIFHLGGQRWEAWNHFIKRTILPGQSREGHEKGSWSPDGNWLGAMGGRIFTTAANVLTLEVYYRYPPLHAYRKEGAGR